MAGAVVLAATLAGGAVAGCAVDRDAVGPVFTARAFPAGAAVDYQLGGAYRPADGVGVVARDSTADPAPGLWSICYVNGFQTQPGDGERWSGDNGALLLRDAAGTPVMDPGWPDEAILDTSTATKRQRIAAELSADLSRCADRGFDAVEIDNLDSFSRSDGRLDVDGAVALARLYAEEAHGLGLLIAQKNAPDQALRMKREVGFDFVVAEECVRYQECTSYTDVYGGAVLDIEYTTLAELESDRERICATPERPRSLVIRDRDLAPAGEAGHVYATC